MSEGAGPERLADRWSKPVDGLCGRLRVEFEDLEPGLRYAIYLELWNRSFEPIAVTNQPQIRAQFFDASANTVDTSGMAIDGPGPIRQRAVIPRDAYVGFRIDTQTVDVPTREKCKVLVALGDKCWRVGAGSYSLQTDVTLAKHENGPEHFWAGKLELPPIEVVVTPAMLKV